MTSVTVHVYVFPRKTLRHTYTLLAGCPKYSFQNLNSPANEWTANNWQKVSLQGFSTAKFKTSEIMTFFSRTIITCCPTECYCKMLWHFSCANKSCQNVTQSIIKTLILCLFYSEKHVQQNRKDPKPYRLFVYKTSRLYFATRCYLGPIFIEPLNSRFFAYCTFFIS